ncbi:hypothetical protein TREMEDRAFT_34698 [Tremella mesenterica DSM 1558]|uniref:uncharacterized protein n=1 Tax=Tremella mesenterica (strain ATCC 24925 / CBS 8224 / DSM 1558 / NBRC 9311 / NRRL Y-6157 / RJB 2259-6 / UBC 559-6) TaxID=578456 RepID=UPI00032C9FCF|nr:uncharacterized protein TREMEDRAFT_34698 [Tremella mesenterica DSM 1558]EIW66820.1 hypothetical protein TREMEDRAFT_34698 [Tremella mesenterica DSM 1558]
MGTEPTPRSLLKKVGQWDLGKTLGRGAYAHVRLATHSSGHKAACKILPALHRLRDRAVTWDETVDAIEAHKEVVLLKALWGAGLRGVVGLESVVQEGGWTYVFLTLYPCSASSLRVPWPRNKLVPFFRHLCHTVACLHSLNISHEDIKRSNVLVTTGGEPRLVDFGFSHFKPFGGAVKSAGGTLDYSSPEKAKDVLYDPQASDVWALGILLTKMLHVPHPYADYRCEESSGHLKANIIHGYAEFHWEDNDRISGLANLVEGMLARDPSKRLTLDQVLEHPYLHTRTSDPPSFKLPSADKAPLVPPHVLDSIVEDLCFLQYLDGRFALCQTDIMVRSTLVGDRPCWEKMWAGMLGKWCMRNELEWEDIPPIKPKPISTRASSLPAIRLLSDTLTSMTTQIPKPARKQPVPGVLREIHLTPNVSF